jgi:histidyl-tRNA synthetase
MTPSIPQGTRDFDAATIRKRDYIFQTIRSAFKLHGFEPLETPAFEKLTTLMGKYGEEGDKLIFKILNNGLDQKADKSRTAFEQVLSGKNEPAITERALKYDLTIPFARYVAMNHGQLAMPFKRFQIQNVWRADRPQKGRYREFTQCDADIVGSQSLLNEVELSNIYHQVFEQLQIPVSICINNRKILLALAQKCGDEKLITSLAVAIDKLDKIGIEKVADELSQKGFANEHITLIKNYLDTAQLKSNDAKLESISNLFNENQLAQEAIEELKNVIAHCSFLVIDFTLARGLDYYTGSIFEVKPTSVEMGSIGGGGRYDDLTGLFGVKDVPGVGISFGVDRIYDVMEELAIFPVDITSQKEVLLINFGEEYATDLLSIAKQLRSANIPTVIFPDAKKLDKQTKYANKRGFEYVIFLGEEEKQKGQVQLKNFKTGDKQSLSMDEAIHIING